MAPLSPSSMPVDAIAITEASPLMLHICGFEVANPRTLVKRNFEAFFVNINPSIKANNVKHKPYKDLDLISDPYLDIQHPCYCGIEGSHDGSVRVQMKQVFYGVHDNKILEYPMKCPFGNPVGSVKFSLMVDLMVEDDQNSSQKKLACGRRAWQWTKRAAGTALCCCYEGK